MIDLILTKIRFDVYCLFKIVVLVAWNKRPAFVR